VFHRVGVYTGSIVKGAKPADLPVLQSTKFQFVINLQTARTLGIEGPPGVLSIADDGDRVTNRAIIIDCCGARSTKVQSKAQTK
jgi:ABC-type uncharacterized transport system substrate-binding protein